jgi:uncharacterized membrane protein
MRNYLSKVYWRDNDIEVIIGHMLRLGVLTSATVAIIGGIMYLTEKGSSTEPLHTVFIGEPSNFKNVGAIIHGALLLQSLSIMQLGVLLLIATPIARIVFSFFVFLLERDKMYVFITLIVLVIIAFSMMGGFSA